MFPFSLQTLIDEKNVGENECVRTEYTVEEADVVKQE